MVLINFQNLISGVFQRIHESIDDIDSETLYPFYVDKEAHHTVEYGENMRHERSLHHFIHNNFASLTVPFLSVERVHLKIDGIPTENLEPVL